MKNLSFKGLNLKVNRVLRSEELKKITGGRPVGSCFMDPNCATGCRQQEYLGSPNTFCSTCCLGPY
ncbi:hypothetical protein [Ulvibacterium sp.]|uniref:hypothetical protein n=1 Tax=Ulvibacterium sp. TaxID=2665914 RepID=UPI002603155F|nr:hypothetical protein [Ulvibacterium sp.]